MQKLLPQTYLRRWGLENLKKEYLQEIRLRVNKPLILLYKGREHRCKEYMISKYDIEQIFQWLCSYAVYAYQDEISKGFITIQGGHRVGIGGHALSDLSGNVNHMRHISSLLIRVSHNVCGIAEPVIHQLYENGNLKSTLILAPPGCGKTTFLRDLLRSVSNGNLCNPGLNVSLIDEREELAAMYMGIPTIDVGERTDVISGCKKATAMEMCLRALAPEVVAVDEIYSEEDISAIKRLYGCGCKVLATHHAYTYEEFTKKTFGQEVLKHGLFERFVLLGKENGNYIVREVKIRQQLVSVGITK